MAAVVPYVAGQVGQLPLWSALGPTGKAVVGALPGLGATWWATRRQAAAAARRAGKVVRYKTGRRTVRSKKHVAKRKRSATKRKSARSSRSTSGGKPTGAWKKAKRARQAQKASAAPKGRIDPHLAPAFQGFYPQDPAGLRKLVKKHLPAAHAKRLILGGDYTSTLYPSVRTTEVKYDTVDNRNVIAPINQTLSQFGITSSDAFDIRANCLDMSTSASGQLGVLAQEMLDRYNYYWVRETNLKFMFRNNYTGRGQTGLDGEEEDHEIYALICATTGTAWPTEWDDVAEINRFIYQHANGKGGYSSHAANHGSVAHDDKLWIRKLKRPKQLPLGNQAPTGMVDPTDLTGGRTSVNIRIHPGMFKDQFLKPSMTAGAADENISDFFGAYGTAPSTTVRVFVRFFLSDGTGSASLLSSSVADAILGHVSIRQLTTFWSPRTSYTTDDPQATDGTYGV
jgi:hypothetical protein